MTLIAVTCGYTRVRKTDDEPKNLGTQLLLLAEHGFRDDLVLPRRWQNCVSLMAFSTQLGADHGQGLEDRNTIISSRIVLNWELLDRLPTDLGDDNSPA